MILVFICVCFNLMKIFEQICTVAENELEIRTFAENGPLTSLLRRMSFIQWSPIKISCNKLNVAYIYCAFHSLNPIDEQSSIEDKSVEKLGYFILITHWCLLTDKSFQQLLFDLCIIWGSYIHFQECRTIFFINLKKWNKVLVDCISSMQFIN